MTKGFFDPFDDNDYEIKELDTLEIRGLKEKAFVSGLLIGIMGTIALGVFVLWITG